MHPEPSVTKTRGHVGRPTRDESWYATFSFLDVGGAVSASQLRRLAAAVSRIWRLTIGRFA
jgi:hypothetical protein